MTDNKLTDNEIIKIKKRLKDIVKENELEYFHSNTMGWYAEIRLAYMAINYLQTEKQNLEVELQAMRGAANSYKAENEKLQFKLTEFKYAKSLGDYEHIKAEAYKEFAEKVKQEIFDSDTYYDTRYKRIIDNLLKELVGEDK